LFSIPFLLILIFSIKYLSFNSIFSIFSIFIVIVVILYNASILDIDFVFSLLVRRVLITPSFLRFTYHDFFSYTEKIGFSGTIIGRILGIQSEFGNTIGVLISSIYRSSDANANASFMVEGFIRFGYFGIFISFLIFSLLLKFIDKVSLKLGSKFTLLIWLVPIFILNETYLISEILFGYVLLNILSTLFLLNNSKKFLPF